MTDTPLDTGMGPDVPATTTRSTRRTRRLAIIGALALVLIAGTVLVGAQVTGSRSGATSSGSYGTVVCTLGSTTKLTPSSTYTPNPSSSVRFTWQDDYGNNKGSFSPSSSSGVWSTSTAGGATKVLIEWRASTAVSATFSCL